MQRSKLITLLFSGVLLWLASHTPVAADEVTNRIEKPVRDAIATRQETQQEQEQWRAKRERLLAKYEALETDHRPA